MMLFPNGTLFLAFSGLYGLAAATMWPAFLAHVGNTNDRAEHGRVMYWLNMAQMLGLGAGVMVGMLLGDFVSYTAVFIACLALNGLALAVALRPADPSHNRKKVTVKKVEKLQLRAIGKTLKPGIMMLGGIILFLSLGIAVFTPSVGTYVKEQLHVPMSEMALLLILPAAVGGVRRDALLARLRPLRQAVAAASSAWS